MMFVVNVESFSLMTEVSKKKKKKATSKWGLDFCHLCLFFWWWFFFNFWLFFGWSGKEKELLEQMDPPSISVIDMFPFGDYPEGEIQPYKDEWVDDEYISEISIILLANLIWLMNKMNYVSIFFFFVWHVAYLEREKKTEEAYCLVKAFFFVD